MAKVMLVYPYKSIKISSPPMSRESICCVLQTLQVKVSVPQNCCHFRCQSQVVGSQGTQNLCLTWPSLRVQQFARLPHIIKENCLLTLANLLHRPFWKIQMNSQTKIPRVESGRVLSTGASVPKELVYMDVFTNPEAPWILLGFLWRLNHIGMID